MIRSLCLKLGMLAITMGLVFWIGWQASDPLPNRAAAVNDSSDASVLSHVPAESETNRPDPFKNGTASEKSGSSHDADTAGRPAAHGLLDLNSASPEDLESLPGIGTVLAQRVIAYRKSVGGFHAIEDLRAVKGIGSRKFDRIKPLVTVAAANVAGKAEKRPL